MMDELSDMPYTDFAATCPDPGGPGAVRERTLSLPALPDDLVHERLVVQPHVAPERDGPRPRHVAASFRFG